MKTHFRDFDFDFNMEIDGQTINGFGSFSKTNKNIQFISKVTEGKYVRQGAFSGHSNTSLLLGNSKKAGIIIINFSDREQYNLISKYIKK